MNKLMKFLTGRYTALSLAVISGTIAAAGCLIILFNLGVGLYQKPLETVISIQAENMQYWYSAKIFSQMETIADTSGNKKIEKNFDAIRTGLHDYLDTKNLEYGVIHADTLHGIDLSDKKTISMRISSLPLLINKAYPSVLSRNTVVTRVPFPH